MAEPPREELAPGAVLLRRAALPVAAELLRCIDEVVLQAPFRHMHTPGGHRMSVAMTNCGACGWITDASGYRYSEVDPETGEPWPALPAAFLTVATSAASNAGFAGFQPDACLVNCYVPGARMTLHQDRNEADFEQPIVSISLGLLADFQFGGLLRSDPVRRVRLGHGDVVVWGGPARLRFHGVLPLKDGKHAATGCVRYNLTLRTAR